ncbi:MAG: Spy/CpxP family protein refolding chaperone [Epsilonproteobacteria bacterium]|nr:Spy/CpxP family protein refolding chaperone [Campylobacterota bacterium]
MKKSIISGLVIISVTTASLMAYGPKGDCKGFGNKPKIIKVLKQLDLTDAQKEILKEMKTAKKEQRQKMREEMRTTGTDMGQYFSDTGFNKSAFVSDKTTKIQTRVNQKADHIEKIYNMLDDTQKQEFVKLIQE